MENRPSRIYHRKWVQIVFLIGFCSVLYLDKPYQVFSDETLALDWATQAGGILITSRDVSDQSWECVVKDNHWQAMIPRKIPLLNDSYKFR